MSVGLRKEIAISVMGQTNAFDDLVIPLFHALNRLGHNCCILRNELRAEAMNILVGLCDLPGIDVSILPKNSVVYNLEQLVDGSKGLNPAYLKICSQFRVWDYSRANISRFAAQYGITGVEFVPLGYCPEMTRINPDYPKDIDVLMYGALNDRRVTLLKWLRERGVNAMGFQGVFGIERDILIARSKIVLNAHYYVPGIQEIIRLSYLWANSKCVVCENNPDTEVHEGYENVCIYAPYDQLVDKVMQLLSQPKAIDSMGRAAFLQFSERRYEAILDSVVGLASEQDGANQVLPMPAQLNVGSGKNFLPEAFNIDINPQWNPDLILDISKKLDSAEQYNTKRFGQISLTEGMFNKIRMFDVLEHVEDVSITMTNLLTLLEDGGELHLCVPYDLGLGAWQDPTHRHAFNENSWLYFTEWHWYMGWREACFNLERIEYIFSKLGKKMRKQGTTLDAILRMPRAVDCMEVHLRKRATTFDEKTMFDKQTRSIYLRPQADWIVNS